MSTELIVLILVGLAIVLVLGIVFWLASKKPSLTRNWSPDQVIMPSVEFLDNGRVRIKNIRNIHYRTTRDYDLAHYDKEFHIDDVDSAWLAISPFRGPGAAHAFLSFGLKDETYVSISIEVRRQKGEKFDPFKAFVRYFEIMYVIADEADVIRVRTNCAKCPVRLYPVQAEKQLIRTVFLDVLKRADKLGKKPEFYNTLWNNCATSIIMHTRRFSKKPIPFWNFRYLFPESLDQIAYRLNIIDTHLPYETARDHFDITTLARSTLVGDDFSKAIRRDIHTRPID